MAETGEQPRSLRDAIIANQAVVDELNAKLKRKTEEVRIIQQISSEINATLDLDRILEIILHAMDEVLEFRHAMILLADEQGEGVLTLAAARGYDDPAIGATVRFGVGAVGVVARDRRLMRLANVRTQRAYLAGVRARLEAAGRSEGLAAIPDLPGLADAESQVAIPLVVKERLVGVFAVEDSRPGAFDELDEMLLSIVANHVASAIDNARLHRSEVARSAALDRAVAELSELNSTLEARVAARTAELAAALAEAERAKQLRHDLLARMAPPEVIPLMLADRLAPRKFTSSILFADLEGFVAFTAGMEPDEMFSRLNHFFAWAGDVVANFRGYVNKTNGDGLMALFGVPAESATHALDAVLAALRLQQEVRELLPLDMRIGVNTGTLTAGLLGPRERTLYDVLGEAVNAASRVEALAPSGGVLIADATHALVRPWFKSEPMEAHEAKGLGAIRCHRVTGLVPLLEDRRRIDPTCLFATECADTIAEIEATRAEIFPMIDFVSIQARDGALGHDEAVAAFALALARRLARSGAPEAAALDERLLVRAALLHDVGKHAIDGQLLNRPGLDAEARERLRAALLAETLAALERVGHREAAPLIDALYGFEAGRAADPEVPPMVEALALADIYEALCAPKLYKGAPWHITGALEEMLRLPYAAGRERPILTAFVELMSPAGGMRSRRRAPAVVLR